MACLADRIFRIKNSTPGPGIKGSTITRSESCFAACVHVDPVCRVSGEVKMVFGGIGSRLRRPGKIFYAEVRLGPSCSCAREGSGGESWLAEETSEAIPLTACSRLV
jgi:hypothetical protein